MTEKLYAFDLTNEEWINWLAEELKQPKFRADQLCQWIWQKKVFDTEEMTNLSVQLRELLNEKMDFTAPEMLKEQKSRLDGTRKYLWRFRDGNTVESVLLKQGDRLTACISTQVGCPLQCTFCATGLSGYVRNLTAGEIAGQFLAMEKHLGREINNIVYMGMGEPFLNTENVLKSIRMFNNPKMRNLGIRHMTVSTSGVIPGIQALAESGLGVRLAISLHAADEELRSMLMPVNQTFPITELREAMVQYQEKTKDRLSIEYALFGGVNDTVEHARALVRFLKGIHVFINLIPFNAVDGRYEKPKTEDVLRFKTVLTTAGFEAEIRQEQGADIDAACGQLRRKTLTGSAEKLEPRAHTVAKADMKHAPRDGAKADRRPRYEDDKPKRTKSPSGGFVEARGTKHRKQELPEKDRYRSGKMKEARPVFRGQDGDEGYEDRRERSFSPRGEKKFSNSKPYNRDNREERGERSFRRDDRNDRGFGKGPRQERSDKPRFDRDSKPKFERGEKPRFNRDDKPKFDRNEKGDRGYRGGKSSEGKSFDRGAKKSYGSDNRGPKKSYSKKAPKKY